MHKQYNNMKYTSIFLIVLICIWSNVQKSNAFTKENSQIKEFCHIVLKDNKKTFILQDDTLKVDSPQSSHYDNNFSIVKKKKGFYFFSDADITNIQHSAASRWGKEIVANMNKEIKKRRKYPLAVPKEEGGHYHEYFCPKHNLQFTFRWNSPKAHYCSACDKEWSGNKRYDWAWIYEVHMKNKEYLYQCMYLYLATGKQKYANYIRSMLLDYASKYNNWFEHNSERKPTDQHSGKAFAQSLDEANWATKVAMAYNVIKPLLSKNEIESIENGYLKPAATLLLHRPASANWQMWHNSGLAALGIALENDSIVDVAINKDKYGYHFLVDKHKNNDGWINEGSPHYHYYPLEALLFTANAVKCRDIDLFNSDLHDMFTEPVKGTYPDLSFPAHSDGWYGANLLSQSALYEVANTRYNDPLLQQVLELTYTQKRRLDPEALLSGRMINASGSQLLQLSYSFDTSGFCLLRSDARTVVLKFGGEGIGHGHPDKLSITIHDGKRELVSDFGTSGYGVPDYLKWYKRSLSHNTVTIDARDQRKSTGKISKFIPRPDGGYAEAETVTAYPGVKMRRCLDLKNNRLQDVSICNSDSSHLYEYVIHFNEKPILDGQPSATTLTGSEVHERIHHTKSYFYRPGFMCRTSSASVCLNVSADEILEVVMGEASGIPANPTVKDGPGAKNVAVKPCYPLIIRAKGKEMKVEANWNFVH